MDQFDLNNICDELQLLNKNDCLLFQAAGSAVEILMVEELTTDAINLESIAARFQNGVQKATQTYTQAKVESRASVVRMR